MMENDLPKRKPTRLKNYNYSNAGAYFLTICTENRRRLLSTIVGEGSPLPELSVCGKIADKYINKLTNKYPQVSVTEYIIMPDHIHMIIVLKNENGRGDPSPTVTSVIGWLKYQITKEINGINRSVNERVFQRSFADHIIRDREDYEVKRKYIRENPIRWYYRETKSTTADQNV